MNKPFIQTIIFIGIGLITTFILLGAKIAFEQTDAGHRLESYGYEILQSYLPNFVSKEDMPVIVVDIGKLKGGTDEEPTPRDNLKEIIGAIAKAHPKAIALDIDFSPKEEGGWQDDNDPEFFDYCLELKEKGIPIFLGVERSIESRPEAWLGLEKYKSLAVGTRFQFPDTNKVILWLKSPNTQEIIPSLSLALAKNYRENLPKQPALLASMLEEIKDYDLKTEISSDNEFVDTKALVNYNMLEAMKSQSLSTISRSSIEEHKERFKDKLVLLGRITNPQGDVIRVMGRDKDIPGVLLHASATYTLAKSPLFEFTHTSRILIDILLPLFILILIAIVRYRNRKNADYNWHGKQWLAIILTVFLVFVGGVVLVRGVGIIWFDFLIVILALLFHPIVEKKIGARLH